MFDDQMRWFGRDHLQRILWWHLDTVASFSTVGKQNCHIWDLRSNLKGRTFPETTSSHLKRGAAFSACFLDISPRRLMGWGDSDSWFWTTVFQDLSLFGSSKWFFQESLWFWRRQSMPKRFMTFLQCHHVIIFATVVSAGWYLSIM